MQGGVFKHQVTFRVHEQIISILKYTVYYTPVCTLVFYQELFPFVLVQKRTFEYMRVSSIWADFVQGGKIPLADDHHRH